MNKNTTLVTVDQSVQQHTAKRLKKQAVQDQAQIPAKLKAVDIHAKSVQTAPLNRRRFLEMTALGGLGLFSYHAKAALTLPQGALTTQSLDIEDTSSHNPLSCITPTISTRIFASSNTGVDEARNVLGLQRLTCAGFDIKNPEVLRRRYLRFGGTDQQRISDLQNMATGAIEVPKLLLAARGGYGAMRLLEQVNWQSLGDQMREKGTILAGFSDVTAVQCALLAQGKMSSLAAPMLYSEFGKKQPDVVSCQGFIDAITQPKLKISLPQQDISMLKAPMTGTLWGGNLSVVSALAGSPYIPNPEGGIVFLEDVGEQPYQVERMLYSLYLSGAFKRQQAIVLGAFSGTGQDSYDARYDMSLVVKQLKQITHLPVFTGLPFGHVARKQSFPLGAQCQLSASDTGIELEFSGYPTIAGELIYPEGLWR
ncbi:LD-carboxypeptidase [Psychrobacter raelei]|uniref:LD-carboxypeptidase n=1 Tax=Psychrobacter raelei TaxID=2565531 RepID=UPI003F625B07